jgi:cell wall-associated NlpC family hydrolase
MVFLTHLRYLLPVFTGISCLLFSLQIDSSQAQHAYKDMKLERTHKPFLFGPSTSSRSESNGAKIVTIARRYIGTPYLWGGRQPDGFDCSGFVQYVMLQAGISVPRNTHEQFRTGHPVERGRLQKGDLVFFQTDTSGASHVGIYAGNQLFIQADATRGVKFSSLDHPYWKRTYLGARRIMQTARPVPAPP